MNRLDLVIDALECAIDDKFFNLNKYEKALAAARELKALEPVAWVVRRTTSEGIMVDGVWTCDSDEEGAMPVYALDEVKHEDAPLP